MPFDTLIALFALLLAMVWTPGPNNAMLSASGAQFGHRASIPHILGMVAGLTSANGWLWFGVWMQHWLDTELRFRLFNLTMAAIIVFGIILLFVDH